MKRSSTKIGIGTAQWGMPYGISNVEGQSSPEQALEILSLAEDAGLTLVDTASLYGSAELLLGRAKLDRFSIVTKTPHFAHKKITRSDYHSVLSAFSESIDRLNVASVYGLLIHDVRNIFTQGGEHLIDAIIYLKQQKKICKIGFSAYTSLQIEKACALFSPDIVQLPINIFDQRLLLDGTIQCLSRQGVEIHARSIFLQGLLLMQPTSIPAYFSQWIKSFESWHHRCLDLGVLPQSAALEWVCRIPEISYALVGFQNAGQLHQLLANPVDLGNETFNELALTDQNLLNPSLWPN